VQVTHLFAAEQPGVAPLQSLLARHCTHVPLPGGIRQMGRALFRCLHASSVEHLLHW
jgi:hypothetical protein